MTFSPAKLYRRLRFGPPIIVVSGLPRSGTSMMMRMLRAGGLELVADEVRTADHSNPEGYFELEQVKTLDKTDRHPWLVDCRGRAVKIISFLLPYLPEGHNYRVIFMRRDLREVIASQNTMLTSRSESVGPDRAILTGQLQDDLSRVERVLRGRRCFEVLDVSYNQAVADPSGEAARVARFLGGGLDVRAMAAAVNPALHRNRE